MTATPKDNMVDCILINSPNNVLASYYESDPKFPIGLLSIAGHLARHGLSVKIIDLHVNDYSFSYILNLVLHNRPKLLGVNISTPNKQIVYKLLKYLKSETSLKIIVGGPHASCDPHDVFSNVPEIDGIVVGEGENIVIDLIKNHIQFHNSKYYSIID